MEQRASGPLPQRFRLVQIVEIAAIFKSYSSSPFLVAASMVRSLNDSSVNSPYAARDEQPATTQFPQSAQQV